jgi:hypothetical protein
LKLTKGKKIHEKGLKKVDQGVKNQNNAYLIFLVGSFEKSLKEICTVDRFLC